jgi:hypothetical protein
MHSNNITTNTMKQPFSREARCRKTSHEISPVLWNQIFIIVVTNHHPQPHECNLYPPTVHVKCTAEPLKAPRLEAHVQQDYIHKAPLISHDNLQLLSHNPLQLLRKKTGTSTTMTA